MNLKKQQKQPKKVVKTDKKPSKSLLTTSKRTYIAKHTHFHSWKPESKSNSIKSKETVAKRESTRIISTTQFNKTRKPFDFPVITKQPIEDRKLRAPSMLNEINQMELARLKALPRETVPFNVGDKIAVTALLSMSEAKTQVFKGTVIERTRGTGLYGRFTLRNNSDGGFYEVTFPYWSPFLRKIEMVEKDTEPLVGKTKLAPYYRSLPADHPKNRAV